MTGITVEQLEEKREVLKHLCSVYKKNREAVPLEELRTRYRTSYEKLLSNLSSELLIYSCMRVRLSTYIDETTDEGLDVIKKGNEYVIQNWRTLVCLAKKNQLDDLDDTLDAYNEDFFEKHYWPYAERNMCRKN